MSKLIRIGLLSAFMISFVFVGFQTSTADAGIITSKKRLRRRASSKGALIRSWWRQHTRTFYEDTKLKRWKIYFAVIFNRRVNDLEVTVRLYDITKTRRFIESFSLWLSRRGEGSVTSTLKLPRDDDGKFRANTKILMKVVGSSSKKTLATTWFRIRGKVKKNSGKVTFTVAETKGLPSGSKGLVKKKKPPALSDMGSAECPARGAGRLLVWGCGSFL